MYACLGIGVLPYESTHLRAETRNVQGRLVVSDSGLQDQKLPKSSSTQARYKTTSEAGWTDTLGTEHVAQHGRRSRAQLQ